MPLALRYFDPRGIFAHLGATYVRQDIAFPNPDADRRNHFVVVDAAVGYRLPKRQGVVSLEVKNLFDKQFAFQDLEFLASDSFRTTRPFIPQRTILLRVTLNWP
jgi:outer membrane receptor protein involved in Fe transport